MGSRNVTRSLIIVVLCGLSICAKAQTTPASLASAEQRYDQYMADKNQVTIYRITVLLTRDRRIMESTRMRFYAEFPEMKLEWSYDQPYYALRTGKYITEREAWADMTKIKEKYPNAILSNERIKPSAYFDQ